jgi:hypothetical protein
MLKNISLFIFCTLLIQNLLADSPCGTFVAKITYYTNSGRQDSCYIYYKRYKDGAMVFNPIDEYFNIVPRISKNQIDLSRVKGSERISYDKILAVNKSVMSDTNVSEDFDGYIEAKKIPFTRKIHELNLSDTVSYSYYNIIADENSYSLDSMINDNIGTIHFARAEYMNLDTIKIITLDTILWCGDNDQLIFLNKIQTEQLLSAENTPHFILADGESQQFWIDFFCFDPKWSKALILSSVNLRGLQNDFIESGGDNVFKEFSPALQKAVRSYKVLYFVRWSP